ncbi:MAG: permease-like cell division protein FtsX [Bacteroidota bacterium]
MSTYTDQSTKRTKPNYIYSIISVALVLFLFGFVGLVLLQSQKLIRLLKERINIVVEMDEYATESDIDTLYSSFESRVYVKEGTVQLIDSEEALTIMQEEFGEDILMLDLPNPFTNVITFNVKAKYLDSDSLANIREELRLLPTVTDVFYQEDLTGNIVQNFQKIGYIVLGISLFFIFVAVTLIHNTIRLALYSNRFLIKNMQLVGASWDFISRPYVMKAIWHGILSSVIALVGLAGFVYWVWATIPEAKILLDISGYIALVVVIIAAGILMNTFSTYFVVNKYLKMKIDDLY